MSGLSTAINILSKNYPVKCPPYLKVGVKFISKWTKNEMQVQEINENTNVIKISVSNDIEAYNASWSLRNVVSSIESKDFTIIP